MKLGQSSSWCRCLLLTGALAAVAVTGCQSTIGGQTLPSAYYLSDDVQYFPAGPEFPLSNTVRAHERYRLEQQGLDEGFAAPVP